MGLLHLHARRVAKNTQKETKLSLQTMQRNNNSTIVSPTKFSSTTHSRTGNVSILLNHWAFDLYVYIFAILFGIFALACVAAFVRQQAQRSRSRNIYGRFTTVQLFIVATLTVVDLFWNPMVLRHVSTEIFIGSLIIGSLYMALNLSALSILLLILLETTKTTLAAPRLQNIWVLCAITAVFTAILLTINLLVLHGNRELWFFISYAVLFAWSITICVGYTVAGYKMWRNSKSSRQLGDSTGKGRLTTIITKVFVLTFTTTVVSILKLFLAASDYSKVPDNITEITKEYVWSRYIITFVNRSCELVLIILIFEIVIRTKTRRNSVNEAQAVQLGTFSEDTKSNYQIGSTG